MTSFPRHIEVETIDWRGVLIEISYEPRWMDDAIIAHLELRTIAPEGAPIPVTETGYRSDFIAQGNVEGMGGPIPYVLAWLEHEAKRSGWAEIEASARQYSLF